MTDLYPVTVCKPRYMGSYAGSRYIAFNMHPFEVPKEPWCDDATAMNYWGTLTPSHEPEEIIGKGDTPQEAIEDLELKIEE